MASARALVDVGRPALASSKACAHSRLAAAVRAVDQRSHRQPRGRAAQSTAASAAGQGGRESDGDRAVREVPVAGRARRQRWSVPRTAAPMPARGEERLRGDRRLAGHEARSERHRPDGDAPGLSKGSRAVAALGDRRTREAPLVAHGRGRERVQVVPRRAATARWCRPRHHRRWSPRLAPCGSEEAAQFDGAAATDRDSAEACSFFWSAKTTCSGMLSPVSRCPANRRGRSARRGR